jgi:hypothetical protein
MTNSATNGPCSLRCLVFRSDTQQQPLLFFRAVIFFESDRKTHYILPRLCYGSNLQRGEKRASLLTSLSFILSRYQPAITPIGLYLPASLL